MKNFRLHFYDFIVIFTLVVLNCNHLRIRRSDVLVVFLSIPLSTPAWISFAACFWRYSDALFLRSSLAEEVGLEDE